MEEHTTPETVKPFSFTEKLAGIFATPGELFENVRQTGKTPGNWVVPSIIFIIVAILMGQLMMTNASLVSQLGSIMQKGVDEAVAKGSMTAEQAEQAAGFLKPDSMIFRIQQVAGIIIITPIALFLLSLVYWLLGKWGMNATAPYMKVVEIAGLTMFITCLESIVTTLLMFAMDSLYATPSLGLFVTDFDIQNKLHAALAKVNVFTIWDTAVMSIGLSKLFQRDLPKVLVLVFALWLVWSVFTVLTGIRFG
jgi:hypothetical protein